MTRMIHRLSAAAIQTLKPGKKGKKVYADGGGLYLQVTPGSDSPSRSWIFRYVVAGHEHAMGLGPVEMVSLLKAREKAAECRKLRYEGIDPLDRRKAGRASVAVAAAKTVTTFREAAKRLIASKRKGWKNIKHAEQWSSTLETYAYPVIGDLPVQAVDTKLVMKILDPIWATKTETASRLRGRIEAVIGSAKAYKEYVGENPARWKDNLDAILAKTSDVAVVRNHPSLPYEQIQEFMRDLRQREGIAAAALEFLVLNVVRPGNAPRWSEIDTEAAVWTVPPEKMKNGREGGDEHKVPLSAAALAVLARMEKIRNGGEFVFYSVDTGGALSDAAMRALIKRMNLSNIKAGRPKWIDKKSKRVIVPHGFRSTFRTWAGDKTEFQREVIEKALAHLVGDETERAYDRGDLFDKRRLLMTAWANYCSG